MCGAKCVTVVCAMVVAVGNAATIGTFLSGLGEGVKPCDMLLCIYSTATTDFEPPFCVNPWNKSHIHQSCYVLVSRSV